MPDPMRGVEEDPAGVSISPTFGCMVLTLCELTHEGGPRAAAESRNHNIISERKYFEGLKAHVSFMVIHFKNLCNLYIHHVFQ